MNYIGNFLLGFWAVMRLSAFRFGSSKAMFLISLGFFLMLAGVVGSVSWRGLWTMKNYRPRISHGMPAQKTSDHLMAIGSFLGPNEALASLEFAVGGAADAAIAKSGLPVFTRNIVLPVLFGLLLPLWALCYSVHGLGAEWESKSIFWLLSSPVPREAIYLAKWFSCLPLTLGWCMGVFWVLCRLAGDPGLSAFANFWPAVAMVTVCYSTIFFQLGACVSRPGLVAIAYTLIFETFLGNMPGSLKQFSISFYGRSLVFNSCKDVGLQLENPAVYLPFSSGYAMIMLLAISVFFTIVGIVWFREKELRQER